METRGAKMATVDSILLKIEYKNGLEGIKSLETALREDNRAETFDVGPDTPTEPTPFLIADGCGIDDFVGGNGCYGVSLEGTRVMRLCDKCVVALYGCLVPPVDLAVILCKRGYKEVCEALSLLKGSYSLIYASLHTGHIYVCKDEYGLKSLLVHVNGCSIVVANTALDTECWYEVPPFKMMVVGNAVSLVRKRNYHLSQLLKAKFVRYDDLRSDIVAHAIGTIKEALVRSILDVCERRRNESVTILFSGGLDSALIARIVVEHMKGIPIELINVSFDPVSSPDRITSLYTYGELVEMFPEADIRLVCIDVDPEVYKNDEVLIYHLSYPNDTHMDLNICASLYYASRLEGYLCDKKFLQSSFWQNFKRDVAVLRSVNFKVTVSRGEAGHATPRSLEHSTEGKRLPELQKCGHEPYTSHSTDVLVGSGADELFGGYGRHVTSQDHQVLGAEVAKDLSRLWKRNLGRDDRVLNANGVRALYPFLSPLVVGAVTDLFFTSAGIVDVLNCPEWFSELSIYKSIDYEMLRNSEFLGAERPVSVYINKWMLREIALQLGLKYCATFKKRAIQFGTSSAKNFNRMHNMSNRQARNKGAATFSLDLPNGP